jgi:hypothetical protein
MASFDFALASMHRWRGCPHEVRAPMASFDLAVAAMRCSRDCRNQFCTGYVDRGSLAARDPGGDRRRGQCKRGRRIGRRRLRLGHS